MQMSPNGYAIKQLKEEVKSSTIFIIPLNSDVDQTPITVNDISTLPSSEIFSKCVTCHLEIPLFEFQEHKAICGGKNFISCSSAFIVKCISK